MSSRRSSAATRAGLARWRRDGVPLANVLRVRAVSQILLELRRSMTAHGMIGWFHTPRAQLDTQTPAEILDTGDDAKLREVKRLARSPHAVLAA
jgi:hypothetical protein